MHFSDTPFTSVCLCIRRLLLCSLILPAFGGISAPLHAQSLSISDINATNFPRMTAKVYAFDANGQQSTMSSNFKLFEDGTKERMITSFTCPVQQTQPVSVVLTMDISGSMSLPLTTDSKTKRLDVAKLAAKAFVEALSIGDGSEAAIVAFETNAYRMQEFTTDKAQLNQVIDGLFTLNGTDYQKAFLNNPNGALTLAAGAKFPKRAIIFLTDGLSTAKADSISRQARLIGATVYCITIDLPVPDILQTIATSTGGKAYPTVRSADEAVQIYRELANLVRADRFCSIQWTSDLPCRSDNRLVELRSSAPALSARGSYLPPLSLESQVTITPRTVPMGAVTPGPKGASTFFTIQLAAGAQDITIKQIRSSDNAFSVSLPANFSPLQAGQPERTLAVQYFARDSGYHFATLTIETTNGCSFDFYATAGYPGVRPTQSALKLVQPDGYEVFLVNTDTTIVWKGIAPSDTVLLDYSIDAGRTWIRVDSGATGLRRPWKVPNTPSDNCYMRVQQKNSSGSIFSGDSSIVLNKSNNDWC